MARCGQVPSLEGIDWEAAAKRSVAHVDRNETAVMQGTHVGYFQHLMNFMGFENGLMAMPRDRMRFWPSSSILPFL